MEPKYKVTLLAANDEDGDPGFYTSLQNGHAETVKAYCEAVLTSKLNDEQKVELLKAKTPRNLDGGLIMALEQGHKETVRAYIEALFNSDLDFNYIEELLKPTRVKLPESLNTIGECAFYNCTSLKLLTIPDSVEEIGAGAFEGCDLSNLVIQLSQEAYDRLKDQFPKDKGITFHKKTKPKKVK